MKPEKKYDIFLSYRRDGGQETARIIRDSLVDRGYKVFFDVEALRSGAFNTKLYSVIEECTDFIVVLSPNALDRCVNEDDWVRKEIEHALEKKKNVIPILLRNFDFPARLPDSLEPLRFRNGPTANMEYYDAFVDKLVEFLHTNKSLWKRILDFLRSLKRLPLFLAAAVLIAAGVTGYWLMQYPRTTEQISLTNAVVTNVSQNLTCLDMMADAQHDMLKAAEEYLQTGDDDRLATEFAICYDALMNADLTKIVPTENLLDWMMDSPLSGDDLKVMYEQLADFRQEGLENLAYIEFILSEESMKDDEQKLHIVNLYQQYLKETRQAFAYATNHLLVPVTREKYLELLWTDTLPYLEEIPLNGRNWMKNQKKLDDAMAECLDNMESIIGEMFGALEEDAAELEKTQEEIRRELVAAGYTEKRAEKIVSYMSRDWEAELTDSYIRKGYTEADAAAQAKEDAEGKKWELDVIRSLSARTTDDVNVLWEKMTYLLDLGFYEEAEECIQYYQVYMDNSDRYMPALVLFLQMKQQGQLEHGIMVMEYSEEEGINDQLMIGDIIYRFNGEDCKTTAEYLARKAALTEDSYTVKLLRLGEDYKVEVLELTLSTDSPGVYLNDLLPITEE